MGSLSGQKPPLDQSLPGRITAAKRWLESRVTPNRVVPSPDASRRGLLVSYELSPAVQPSGYHRSATYDDAVAALAFLATGDRDRAAFTLHALTRLLRPDSSVWFTYNTANNWPTERDHESALVRAGTVSWVGYALTLYAMRPPAPAPGKAAAAERERTLFLSTAKQLAHYLMSLQVNDPHDPRDGLLRLGYGWITLAYDTGAHRVIEQYRDSPVGGVSIENNIAAWFFLRRLGAVSGEGAVTSVAERIGGALRTAAWSDELGQFIEGFGEDGTRDPGKALDCASLGALFLLAQGDTARASETLAAAERYYASRGGPAVGYRPYADQRVYGNEAVGRFFFPERPRTEWRELPLVWSEGSLQVALAYLRLGRHDEARRILEGVAPLQEPHGGVRYASRDVPYEMADVASVAGSAWLILVGRALSGDPLALEVLR